MSHKIIKSTDHPVVTTYMEIIKKAIELSCGMVDVVEEKNNKKNLKSKKDILIVDSPIVALRYRLKGFKNFVIWYQGVLPEESFLSNHSRVRSFILSKIEKHFLKHSKMLFLVSNEMLIHYERKYKIDISRKSIVMPCFNETEINTFDDEKYNEDTFVYIGGLQVWQCFEQTVEVYSKLEKLSDYKTKFYVYTSQIELANKILEQYNVQNYKVAYVDKEKLSKNIKGIKYGFVLREDNVINNVATPTKFSNYIANGIIPIYSNSLKSFAEYDKRNKLGILCNLDDINAGIKNIFSHMNSDITAEEIRSKCQKVFTDYYNFENYIKIISDKIKDMKL